MKDVRDSYKNLLSMQNSTDDQVYNKLCTKKPTPNLSTYSTALFIL